MRFHASLKIDLQYWVIPQYSINLRAGISTSKRDAIALIPHNWQNQHQLRKINWKFTILALVLRDKTRQEKTGQR